MMIYDEYAGNEFQIAAKIRMVLLKKKTRLTFT